MKAYMNATGSNAVTYPSADRIATSPSKRPERMNRIDANVVEGLHAAWARFMGAMRPAWRSRPGPARRPSRPAPTLGAPPANLYRDIPGVGVPVDKPVIGAVAGWVVRGGIVLTTHVRHPRRRRCHARRKAFAEKRAPDYKGR